MSAWRKRRKAIRKELVKSWNFFWEQKGLGMLEIWLECSRKSVLFSLSRELDWTVLDNHIKTNIAIIKEERQLCGWIVEPKKNVINAGNKEISGPESDRSHSRAAIAWAAAIHKKKRSSLKILVKTQKSGIELTILIKFMFHNHFLRCSVYLIKISLKKWKSSSSDMVPSLFKSDCKIKCLIS